MNLFQWDPEIQYKSILILEGGYENYILMYPMDCTNPNVRPPSWTNTDMQDDALLDDIEYPSLSDITMKEKSISNDVRGGTPGASKGFAPPAVDRSSKLAALKSYNSRKDLLKEQHEIADKLLASQRECLNEELELAEIIKKDERASVEERSHDVTVDDHPPTEGEDKINESRFRIMQLDNSIEDAMLKKQLVEETKAVVPEADSEAQDNIRILASIRQKEEEIREIRAKRERIAKEREEKLRLAKEQKKNLVNNNNRNHIPTSTINKPSTTHVPSHPVVDRSVKPMTPAAIADFDVRRDFAPVYGQVVSNEGGVTIIYQ